MKYDFNKHLIYSRNVSNSLWDYKKLLNNNRIQWSINKSLYIEWSNILGRVFEIRYDIDGFNEELMIRLSKSDIIFKESILMTFGSDKPILEMSVNYFIQNWEELVFLSNDTALVWSNDSELIMEFNGKFDRLFSNFKI